jgi:hypothetical protein
MPVGSGANGLEVITVLLAWKLVAPASVLLNRGNHEDRNQNMYYNRGQHGCWVRQPSLLTFAVARHAGR